MVELKIQGYFLNATFFRPVYFVLIFLVFSQTIKSQDPSSKSPGRRTIELINADDTYIIKDKITGKDIHRLLGNVVLTHNDIKMSCDSAHLANENNELTAFSNVHIEQGDTLDLYGDHLFYDRRNEIAYVTKNVELVDKETHLYTDAVVYDVKNEIARYNTGGRIINSDNTLTSIIGVYYVNQSLFNFKDSVKIVNPDYVMTADTMDYNTETETAFFTGPTEMKGDSIYVYCEKGWYDTKLDITRLWKNALIDNKQQIIKGDSLYYENITGYGQSFGNVSIADTNNKIMVTGNYAWYYKQPERFTVTDRAVFIQFSDNDSLFLHADTISAKTIADTSLTGYRLMRAYYGCRIFSRNLQAKCDSLSYSFRDSVIRFYESPVIWSEESQLTSDSMAVFTKNGDTDRMELYNSAFVTSQVDSVRFNQIKGRNLTGYFENNELYKIDVVGNGESVYHLVDNDNIVGVNTGTCARIQIFVKDGAITDIIQFETPEGLINPPVGLPSDKLRLKGFEWFDSIRPKKIEDIFIKNQGH
jgi:lipopolysaccharide export system protein LptA